MFNLPENVKKFHLDDDSIDVEAMQQCNLARWARGEKLEAVQSVA